MSKEFDEQKFLPKTAFESARNNIWAQLEKDGKAFEPAKAYDAFLIYCEMPAPRSILEMVKNKLVEADKRTLERYSAKFDWQRRAFAYDQYIALLEQNARDVARFNSQRKWTERREDVRNSEWNDAQQLRQKAKEFLSMPFVETKTVSEETGDDGETIIRHITKLPIRSSLADVVRMIDLANKLERNAVDAETDRIVIETPQSRRHSDVLKARKSFEESAALFPTKSEAERAETIARAFNVTVTELLAPEEMLSGVIQDSISDLPN